MSNRFAKKQFTWKTVEDYASFVASKSDIKRAKSHSSNITT